VVKEWRTSAVRTRDMLAPHVRMLGWRFREAARLVDGMSGAGIEKAITVAGEYEVVSPAVLGKPARPSWEVCLVKDSRSPEGMLCHAL